MPAATEELRSELVTTLGSGQIGSVISLMYHDVVSLSAPDASGFPGRHAARYKISPESFRGHLGVLRQHFEDAARASEPRRKPAAQRPVCITFDDGGSCSPEIAAVLGSQGYSAHFFVVTGRIGEPGFVSQQDITEIRRMGHLIGSHSHSHPDRISDLSFNEILTEWKTSVESLSDLLSERVTVASVPRGAHSPLVSQAAREAGIQFLFTSEPTATVRRDAGMYVLGRYTFTETSSHEELQQVLRQSLTYRLRNRLIWRTKEAIKASAPWLWKAIAGKYNN